MIADIGIVRIQAQRICPATAHRTADSRRVAPPPTMAPVIVCVVLMPTPSIVAVKIARLAAQSFVANLTGHPCVVVPCVREGLPIAMQIIGRHNDEARVLAAARMVERSYGARRPPLSYA